MERLHGCCRPFTPWTCSPTQPWLSCRWVLAMTLRCPSAGAMPSQQSWTAVGLRPPPPPPPPSSSCSLQVTECLGQSMGLDHRAGIAGSAAKPNMLLEIDNDLGCPLAGAMPFCKHDLRCVSRYSCAVCCHVAMANPNCECDNPPPPLPPGASTPYLLLLQGTVS